MINLHNFFDEDIVILQAINCFDIFCTSVPSFIFGFQILSFQFISAGIVIGFLLNRIHEKYNTKMTHFYGKTFVEEILILPNVISPRQTFCRKNKLF